MARINADGMGEGMKNKFLGQERREQDAPSTLFGPDTRLHLLPFYPVHPVILSKMLRMPYQRPSALSAVRSPEGGL